MHLQCCCAPCMCRCVDRCCEHQRTHLLHALYRMCICDRCRYIYIYVHRHMYIYICICTGMCVCVCVCIHVCMYVYVYVYLYIYMCMHVCVCMCTCICVYVYVYIQVHMYFLRRDCMHLQVLLSTMYVQVCTLDRCCEHQRTHLLHARYRMCICAMYIHVYMHICNV